MSYWVSLSELSFDAFIERVHFSPDNSGIRRLQAWSQNDMADEQKISDILILWDEQRQAGEEPSAADLCSDCPELTNEVASRIQALKNTDWMFGDDTAEDDAFLSLPNDASSETNADSIELPESTLTTEAFATAISDSGLSIENELSAVRSKLPADHSAMDLARELIWQGHLTVFQATTLLQQEPLPLVLGDYEIRDRIGAGGMGEVYKARHRRMKRVVALKILPQRLIDDEAALKRFNREVEIVASLEHPNIVTAHDAGEQNGTHYLIMQYVDGCDMTTLIRTAGTLPVERAIDFTLQAARGLAHAHAQGVTHRDIKPSNILINKRGQVKILDLGLARVELSTAQQVEQREGLTTTGAVMGTVDYMAPEQAVNTRTADHRADIYSLGCTLHFLLTANPPYSGETMMERLLAHREQPVPSLQSRRDDVPDELEATFQKMLAKTPDERFASMTDVVVALESLLTDTSTAAGRVQRGTSDESGTTALPHSMQPAEMAPEDSATELYNQPAVAVVQQQAAPQVRIPGDTLNQSTVNTDPSLAPTIIKSSGQTTGRGNRFKWIELAVLLTGAAVFFYSVTIGFKTPDGTIWLTGDPNLLEGAKVFIDDQHVLTIESTNSPKPVKVSVDTQKGKLRVERDGFVAFGREFDLALNTDRQPINVRFDPDPSVGRAQRDETPDALPPAVAWQPGPAEGVLQGIVSRPAAFEGIKRWQLETTAPRSRVLSVDWSPDGRLIAVGTRSGLRRIYDAKTLKCEHVLPGHPGLVASVAWSDDGEYLASVGDDATLLIWSRDGTSRAIPNEGNRLRNANTFAWSPDGSFLAVAILNGSQVGIWTAQGEFLRWFDFAATRCVDWSPDGNWIVAGSEDGEVRIWKPDGTAGPAIAGHDEAVRSVAWSPDSQSLATAGGDNTIRIWRVDGTAGPSMTTDAFCKAVAWSHDGTRIAASSVGPVEVFDADGSNHRTLPGQYGNVFGVAWSPDDKRIVSVGETGVIVHPLDGSAPIELRDNWIQPRIAWNPAGQQLAVSYRTRGNYVRLLSPAGAFQRTTRMYAGGHLRPAWSPDGSKIFLGWESIPSGCLLAVEDLSSEAAEPQLFRQAGRGAWNPSGDRIATVYTGEEMLRISDASGKKLSETPLPRYAGAVAWHPDGEFLVTATSSELVLIAADGTRQRTVAGFGAIEGLAWSPDGRWLAGANTSISPSFVVSKDDLLSETLGTKPDPQFPSNAESVAWSPDSQSVAIGLNPGVIQILGTDGTFLRTFPQQWGGVGTSLTWSSDGRYLTSSNDDSRVINWNAETGEVEWVHVLFGGRDAATVSAAGQFLQAEPDLIEKRFVYIVEHHDGHLETLKPSEFQKLINQPLRYAPAPTELDGDRDHLTAEWVLSIGGKVDVEEGSDGQLKEVTGVEELPGSSYRLHSIKLHGN